MVTHIKGHQPVSLPLLPPPRLDMWNRLFSHTGFFSPYALEKCFPQIKNASHEISPPPHSLGGGGHYGYHHGVFASNAEFSTFSEYIILISAIDHKTNCHLICHWDFIISCFQGDGSIIYGETFVYGKLDIIISLTTSKPDKKTSFSALYLLTHSTILLAIFIYSRIEEPNHSWLPRWLLSIWMVPYLCHLH